MPENVMWHGTTRHGIKWPHAERVAQCSVSCGTERGILFGEIGAEQDSICGIEHSKLRLGMIRFRMAQYEVAPFSESNAVHHLAQDRTARLTTTQHSTGNPRLLKATQHGTAHHEVATFIENGTVKRSTMCGTTRHGTVQCSTRWSRSIRAVQCSNQHGAAGAYANDHNIETRQDKAFDSTREASLHKQFKTPMGLNRWCFTTYKVLSKKKGNMK